MGEEETHQLERESQQGLISGSIPQGFLEGKQTEVSGCRRLRKASGQAI